MLQSAGWSPDHQCLPVDQLKELQMKYRLILGATLVAAPLAMATTATAETIHPDLPTYAGATLNTTFPKFQGWFIRERTLTDHSLTRGDDLPDNQKPVAPSVTLSCASASSLNVRIVGQDPTSTIVPVNGLVVADGQVLNPDALAGFSLVHDQVVTRIIRVQGSSSIRVRPQIDAFDNSLADTRTAWVSFDVSKCAPSRTRLKAYKVGPAKARQGKPVRYRLTAHNVGAITANNVVIRDRIPSGMVLVKVPKGATFRSGILTWKVGNIAPNDTKTVTVWLRFPRTSRTVNRCNIAEASASNANHVSDKACTRFTFVEPDNPVLVAG